MKTYAVNKIRNVGLFSHGGAGKTSLTEALLYCTDATSRLGRVEDGNTVSDWDADEIRRNISISTSIAPLEYRDHKINILDVPGYADFVGEVQGAMRVVDSALILIDAAAGIEVGTEHAWKIAERQQKPRALLINKMDRDNADFDSTVDSARTAFGESVVPLYMPIGAEKAFTGLVDLLSRTAYEFDSSDKATLAEIPLPDELEDQVEIYRTELIERICEVDEELMLRYLEDEEISVHELTHTLADAIASRELVPVFASAVTSCKGVSVLLDAFVNYFPAPQPEFASNGTDEALALEPDPDADPAAILFKTVADPFVGKVSYLRVYSGTIRSDSHLWDVQKEQDERLGQLYVMRGKEQIAVSEISAGDIGAVTKLQVASTGDTLADQKHPYTLESILFPKPAYSAAVYPHSKTDLDKMGTAISRLLDEDPTLTVSRDPSTGETIVSGVGESHVQISLERMARKFGVNVDLDLPQVPYRETISRAVTGVEYKHKKQSGGHGQYGHVVLDIEPIEDGTEEFEFAETIVGGAVPKQFIPGVEKGIREALADGVMSGYPVVNVKVTLTDGSYHTVDSSEMAFKLAAAQAFRKGMEQAGPVLLEPVMHLKIWIPESYVGDVMSDMNSKRGHVDGMTPGEDGTTLIEATAPAAEVQRYATDLRSITQGRGSFTIEFSHYQPVPQHLTENVIKAAQERQHAHV